MAVEFPLAESFFPQVVLNAEEVRYYKRLGKERLNELIRIAEDAELAYKWTNIRTPKLNIPIQKTQFLDMRPATKATFASTLIKCSVVIPDTRPNEVMMAIARSKTKEYRKMMGFLHDGAFLDGRTLFKFPSSIAASRPEYSYRAIKWCALKGKGGESNKLDFSFLEYAGKKKPSPGSMVVGFCLQESIQREREIPLLEDYGFVRGYLSRSGIIVSKTHQSNVVRVTAICQIDGDIEPNVRAVLEGIMQDMVGSVMRMRGLLDRQRVGSMKFLAQFEWVANSDRKACAVCLKGFFFHRKHHCRACGEVVCSSCAPLRELDEPIHDIKELRICTSCMSKAGRLACPEASSNDRNNGNNNNNETLTSDESTESFNGHESRGHAANHQRKNTSLEDRQFMENEARDRMRRPSDAAQRLLDNSNKGTPKSKRRITTFLKNPRETVATLTGLVDQIREARDTINITISEAGESRMSFGEEDAYTELYDRATRLRDTVEFQVDNGGGVYGNNGAAARGTQMRRPSSASSSGLWRNPATGGGGAMPTSRGMLANPALPDIHDGDDDDDDHHHAHDNDHDDEDEDELYGKYYENPNRFSDETVEENFNSVVKMTFAAAQATRAVGRAVLSSCASDNNYDHDHHYQDHDEIDEILPSPSEASGYSDSDTPNNNDPYSLANYNREMARIHHGVGAPSSSSHRGSLSTPYEDGYTIPSTSQDRPRRTSRVELLEKKIADLQRNLMDAHRKLSFFEVDDEPEPEFRTTTAGLGTVPEDIYDVEGSLVFRPNSSGHSDSNNNRQRTRRPSDVSQTAFPTRNDQRRTRTPPPIMKPRAKSASQMKTDFADRHSLDVGAYNHQQQQPGEYARRGSELRARRPSAAGTPTSRASSSGRAHSTAEHELTLLRSVMNSDEVTRPTRRSSMVMEPVHTNRSAKQRHRSSSPSTQPRKSYSGSRPPPPPPPASASVVTMYIDDKGRMLPGTPSSSMGSDTKPGLGLDRTASSSASCPIEGSRPSEEFGMLRSSGGPRTADSGLGSTRYSDFAGHMDDETSSDDVDIAALAAPHDDIGTDDDDSSGSFFGDHTGNDVVFLGTRAVPTAASRPPQAPRSMLRRGSMQGLPPAPPSRQSMAVPRGGRGRDESDELRDLMEGLVRPRSLSTPFRGALNEDPYDRPTHSDGAAVRRHPSPYRPEPIEADRYERPMRSEDPYAHHGMRPPRSDAPATPTQREPRQVEGAIAQVRACLASLHEECPSQWERHRKLQSIAKILRSLQKEGVRSKHRSLSHEEFQYERVLEETPSIVNLLRIAGYVSHPQNLVMRNVDQAYLAVLLREIEAELNEMQATQDYL